MANQSIKPANARQYPLFAEQTFDFSQLADTAVPVTGLKLPYGAQIIGGAVIVDTAFDTGTSAVLDVGDSVSGNRYKNDVNLKATGLTALVPTGHVSDGSDLLVTPTLVGTAATVGKVRVQVQYVIAGRAHEVQTN